MVSMTKYRQRTISFTLPRDQEALEAFDQLSEEHRGNTNAGHHLIKLYMDGDLREWSKEDLVKALIEKEVEEAGLSNGNYTLIYTLESEE